MWPKLSNIHSDSLKTIIEYSTADKASQLSSWIRVFSGATKGQFQGLVLQSNTDYNLVRATGEATTTLYGDSQSSGIIGLDWTGKVVESNSSRALRPSPIITGFSSKEGQDQISREATIQLKAFTLEQMEEIQRYFLEPGYSLFIEWGWNTSDGYRGYTSTNKSNGSVNKLVKNIAKKSLNFQDLISERRKCKGQYDAFLGFIVGGNVSSDGDVFNIEVRLRGEPSLPTYLQGYRNSKKLNSEGTLSADNSDKVNSLFSVAELTDESEASVAKRRFRYMFNELPSDKQLNKVKNLINEQGLITPNMFINFDKHIEKKIMDVTTTSWFYGGDKSAKIEKVEIQKEDLFSKNKYLRMDLVVQILNTLGKLDRFDIGDKNVSFNINIDNTVIGGFPNIFSTNPNKLIIPGKIPDFSQYFLEGETIIQLPNGNLDTSNGEVEPVNPDDTLTPFLGQKDLNENGYKELKNHYGYLKYLFVNFDVVKSVLNKKIINSREAFTTILNEISSAVNAYWKFQIVEGEFVETPSTNQQRTLAPNEQGPRPQEESPTTENFVFFPTAPKKRGDLIIEVIDEHFIGSLPDNIEKNITEFQHNGTDSVFLSANLDISLPSSMVGYLVSSRLGASVDPDQQTFTTGQYSYFESDTDLFMNARPDNSSPTSNTGKTERTSKEIQEEIDNIGATRGLATSRVLSGVAATGGDTREWTKDGEILVEEKTDSSGNTTYSQKLNTAESKQLTQLLNDKKSALEKEQERRTSNLQAYLEKLDVVPKPSLDKIAFDGSGNNKIEDDSLTNEDWVKSRFAFFTFEDSDFFDTLKQQEVRQKYKKTNGKSLSTLIPITYTFTILGNSAIQRGDVFRIKGIPEKYSKRGLFQVTEIEQTLEQGKWVTQVSGKFRQTQG